MSTDGEGATAVPVRIVVAAGDFVDLEIEHRHIGDRPVEIRMASLATAEDVARETADADAIIVTIHPLPAELIDALAPSVRIIGRAGIGLDAIDLEAARRRGIAVFHTPNYATEEVATHAVAMILALNRRLVDADAVARGDWDDWIGLRPVAPISSLSVGVVGLGAIGRAVIDRLRPFGPAFLGLDPQVDELDGVELVESLDELLRRSDIVSLHAPLTPATERMLGAEQLRLLPAGAIVVNVSRGGLIDEEALRAAVQAGTVRAGLDVRAVEPPPSPDALGALPHVLQSPHFAWFSDASEQRVRTDTVDGLVDHLSGREPRTGRLVVDPR